MKGSNGDDLRKAALALLQAARASLIRKGQRALISRLLTGSVDADADIVRTLVPLPSGIDPRVFGQVTAGLSEAGIIKSNGMRPSRRPECHGRKIEIWILGSVDAARQWMACHPEIPDPRPTNQQGDLFSSPEGGNQ